jgi:hypothetical protein
MQGFVWASLAWIVLISISMIFTQCGVPVKIIRVSKRVPRRFDCVCHLESLVNTSARYFDRYSYELRADGGLAEIAKAIDAAIDAAASAEGTTSRGCVLYAVGAHLRFEIEEGGLHELGELGIDDAPAGISVWEGTFIWQPGGWECPQDGDMFPKGVFRPPTAEEWQSIREGRCPWQETPCICDGSVGDYEGPLADCPTHGGLGRAPAPGSA